MIKARYEHQQKALDASRWKRAFALLMEMGTGKTRVLIEDWSRMIEVGKSQDMVVIAPAGVYRNWEGELKEWLPQFDEAELLVWKSKDSDKKRQALLDRVKRGYPGPRVLLINIEALSTVKKAREVLEAFVTARPNALITIDESTTIKNHKSARTKYLLNLVIKIGYGRTWRRIMSGLLAPRSPMDVFSQFAFLDPRILGFSSFYAFRARYAIVQKVYINGQSKRPVDMITGYKNERELHEKLARASFRVLKKDCLSLPPKIMLPPRLVELTDEQAAHYDSIRKQAMTVLDSGAVVSTDMAVTTITRLHQLVCGYLVDDDGKIHNVKSNRIESLVELLDELDGKALIWANFRKSLADIAARLRKEYGDSAVVEYWGDTGDEERPVAVDRFQHDPACRFFVGNPATGGKGLTLTEASLVVYFSNSWDLEHRAQSEDRAHRAGLRHSVTYVDLVAPDTVDEKIVASLAAKSDLAGKVTGDNLREFIS